jgi:hypothetical protein
MPFAFFRSSLQINLKSLRQFSSSLVVLELLSLLVNAVSSAIVAISR